MKEQRAVCIRNSRGFSLVELMTVVVIIGVLAAVAVSAYGRITKRSRVNDAAVFFATINGAQNSYFDLYNQFGATDRVAPYDGYDPSASDINGRAHRWDNPLSEWQELGIRLPRYTWFQYVVVSGGPTDNCFAPSNMPTRNMGSVGIPACNSIPPNPPGIHWYYVVGRADQNGNDYLSCFGSSNEMAGAKWSIAGIELE